MFLEPQLSTQENKSEKPTEIDRNMEKLISSQEDQILLLKEKIVRLEREVEELKRGVDQTEEVQSRKTA